MKAAPLENEVKAAHDQLADLRQRINVLPEQERQKLLREAVEDFSVVLDELRTASEKLHQQNEELVIARQLADMERQRYVELFDFAPEGYLMTDPEGVIREANRAASTLFSVPQGFLIGKPLAVFVKEEDLTPFRTQLDRLPALERLENWEIYFKRQEREPFLASITITTVRDSSGKLIGLRWVVHDVSERKRIEEQLRNSVSHLRFVSEELLAIQEGERKDVARELHDGFEALLATARVSVDGVIQELRSQKIDKEAETLEIVLADIRNASEQIRRIHMGLRPAILDDLGIGAALNWFTREFQKVYPHVRVEKEIDIDEGEIPESLRIVIYRVIQEACTHIAIHGKADHIRFTIGKKKDKVQISIEDNGDGENPLREDEPGRGLGLLGVCERVELSGGSFEIEPSKGTGMNIRAWWPLEILQLSNKE